MKKFSIGEMASICNVSIQTLRYYDKINLIKPIERDTKSNYRYYSIEQAFRINTIKYLQSSGLSIEEIREACQLTGDELANFLKQQSHQIDQQIKSLKNSQKLLNGQIQQLSNLKQIQQYPVGQIFQQYLSEQTILQIPVEHEITPLTYPDEDVSELNALLKDNGTMGNLQYGFSYPLKDYQRLSDIKYHQMFTRIFETDLPALATYLTVIPEGDYLCIPFYWNRGKYLDYYRKLWNCYRGSTTTVYEISAIDHYGYGGEANFISELCIKI